MKKFFILILLTALFLSLFNPVVFAETPKENVIIVFKDDVIENTVTKLHGEIEEIYQNIPVVSGEVPESAIPLLENNKDILTVEVDQRIQINGQVEDWGIQKIHAPISWKSNFTGKGIKIAVLDTGISPHEDLVIAGGISITSYTSSFHDDNGHGTHVAGIIGAENNTIGTVGAAPDADVFAVKVLDHHGTGYLSDIIKGIDWAISNKMDIINLSLGTSNESLALRQAVDKAYNSGILVVTAAGNNGNSQGTTDSVEYPARYSSTIAVSATDSANLRGSFSATGNTVEVAAPGVNILSTYLNNQYVYMSGTSMATPYVAGTLALLKQMNPSLSPALLREKLKETVLDLGKPGKDIFYGYGLVQLPIPLQETIATEQPTMQDDSAEGKQEQPVVQVTEPPSPVVQPVKQPAPTTPIQQPVKQPVNSVPKKVVKKPAKKKSLTLTVSTARSTYSAGHTIWVKAKVMDKGSKKSITNNTVKLTITPPKGKAKVITLKTNKKGEVSYKLVTNKRSVKGIYKFTTSTTVTNYYSSSTSKTIRLK